MASEFLLYRLQCIKESVQVLRSTLDRRVYVDDVIEQRMSDIDIAVSQLEAQLKKEKQ